MISLIVPLYNEEANIKPLVQEIQSILSVTYEIILINDSSTDSTWSKIKELAATHKNIKAINLRRNFGQTAAIMAGIDFANGDIIISLDGDLQNDPADIPRLLDKIEEGYDVVSGWRKERKDNPLKKNLVSKIANKIISFITGINLHDYGCTLKAYRKEIIKSVRLYGEMHRFIPVYASWQGAKITEIPVNHRPRTYGKSKYGLERIFKVILDLLVVKFLDKHFTKPIYTFGGFGIVCFATGILFFIIMIYLKIVHHISMILTPLPNLIILFFLISIISILLGLLAEIVVRTYFESQNKMTYLIKETINIQNHYIPKEISNEKICAEL